MTAAAFHRPSPQELRFRQALLADPATMAYNRDWGGTIPFPPERWAAWYARWVEVGPAERFYRYILDPASGQFVGEAAWHREDDAGLYIADVIVTAPYRRRGYGGQALALLCGAARANGIDALYDRIVPDGPGLRLFLAHGFVEVARTDAAVTVKKHLIP